LDATVADALIREGYITRDLLNILRETSVREMKMLLGLEKAAVVMLLKKQLENLFV